MYLQREHTLQRTWAWLHWKAVSIPGISISWRNHGTLTRRHSPLHLGHHEYSHLNEGEHIAGHPEHKHRGRLEHYERHQREWHPHEELLDLESNKHVS